MASHVVKQVDVADSLNEANTQIRELSFWTSPKEVRKVRVFTNRGYLVLPQAVLSISRIMVRFQVWLKYDIVIFVICSMCIDEFK